MLGIIFVSFTEFVVERHGLDGLDELLEDADGGPLTDGGAYTAVGQYPHTELALLVHRLSKRTRVPQQELLLDFGYALFKRLSVRFPYFIEAHPTAHDFLQSIQNHIHAEVKKLYPEAELPTLASSHEDGKFVLTYRSPRDLPDLCEGLIRGCLDAYGETASIHREVVSERDAGVRFSVSLSTAGAS